MKTFEIIIEQKSYFRIMVDAPNDYEEDSIHNLIDLHGVRWEFVDDDSTWNTEIYVYHSDPLPGDDVKTLEHFKQYYLEEEI